MKEEADIVGWSPADPVSYTNAAGATHWYPEAAATLFFSDCSEETATWAAARLRGQFWRITEEITPRQSWPDVPSASIIGAEDLVINPVWSRRVSPTVVGRTGGGARQRALSVSVSAQRTGSDSCRPCPRVMSPSRRSAARWALDIGDL